MEVEIEAKFTDIDKDEVRGRLARAGAELIHSQRLMRRVNFNSLDDKNAWVRVRDEGDKVTMTYKQAFERTLHGTHEINLRVDDYSRAIEFLEVIGLQGKAVQETKREFWRFNECEVAIDTWPWIPTFVEIEGPSEHAFRMVASQLGFDWEKAMFGSVETVYQLYYNVTEKDVDSWSSITFVSVPDWLERRRK